jgi:hypothetical protein
LEVSAISPVRQLRNAKSAFLFLPINREALRVAEAQQFKGFLRPL